jgi:hypothetical protein
VNLQQFKTFLDEKKQVLKKESNMEKLKTFIDWCKKKDMEELILRLSSEGKGGWSENCFLDFTTTRLIITKKGFSRKFLDVGYIAGLAALPSALLSDNLRKKLSEKENIIMPSHLLKENGSYFMWYSDIEEFMFSKGIESTIVNMFGRMVVSNHIRIRTKNETHEYKLPVNKNGRFEQVFPWLSAVLPFKISTA